MEIVFTDTLGIPKDYEPKPADYFIPDWYKNTQSYINDSKTPPEDGSTTSGTIKRCMPVFDALASGYIITTYTDLYVSQRANFDTDTNTVSKQTLPWYQWPSFEPLDWHPVIQAEEHPTRKHVPKNAKYPKLKNPWSIKTPPGYSTLFIAPMHRDNPIRILEGVVDTDTFLSPVNFPFTLSDWTFEGLIPAGTPVAQVIPFKRENWEMRIGVQKDLDEQNNVLVKLRTKFFDSYKTQFRQPKEYR